MLRILYNTSIDFIRLRRQAAIGIAIFLLPLIPMMFIGGYRYSIEFTGGTLLQLEFQQRPDVGEVRQLLAETGFPDAEITNFGENALSIRARGSDVLEQQAAQGSSEVARRIETALDQRYGAGSYEVILSETVGPKVGGELRTSAIIALLIAFGLTLIYLAWRFEWRFSLAAVLATVHDIVATLALIRYMNLEVSLFVVGGVLTVIGYSMNDKVVVFDRVRENLRKSRNEPLYDLLNRSVNETLPRTVMTGSTTLACLLALLIFGGEVIRPFAWVLTFGILVGTFSSIYVASPLLLWIERRYPRTEAARGKVSAAAARAESEAERRARTPRAPQKPAATR
ncbi:MAG TPA: protein translocase subunit SecF [Gemmatimonadaceae bacterium]